MKVSTRRTFLGQMMSVPVVASAGSLQLFALPGMAGRAALVDRDNRLFAHPDVIRYDAHCFTIHGKDAFVYSAAFHYCRTPKQLWRDRMMKLKLAGFNTIETYVFWNYHEPVEGQADMSELEEFVALVKELGLWMILRIGPYVCAEWDAGGFPHWLIAKQFPLRSDDPRSVESSRGWFNHVLPIVKRNMITADGPVILVQIENEYDYWHISDSQKVNYITALANMVWDAGVDVPIFTNWASQTHDKSNPVMARLMDTGDFYPRWDIQKDTVPRLAALRIDEPASPLGIAELQGGWFSQYGGKLSHDQEGVDGAQLNLLTKTVIESGTSFTNFYMAHGGTNFQWAARKVTTTYDYAAPITEPGGLWEKYYAARTIGCFLDPFGAMLVRCGQSESVSTTNADVSVSVRHNGKSGVLFVRENANDDQEFQVCFALPDSSRTVTIPHAGTLTLQPRAMKMLPVGVELGGGELLYTTAEVLAHGTLGDGRNYLLLYGEPGEAAEIAFTAERNPKLTGVADYEFFDAETRTALFGFHVQLAAQMFLWSGDPKTDLQIIVLPRSLAERTWLLPASPAAGSRSTRLPVITDCKWLEADAPTGTSLSAMVYYAAGVHEVCIPVATKPSQCLVDETPVDFRYDPRWQTVRFAVVTPELTLQAVSLMHGEYLVETFDPTHGDWLKTKTVPLEMLGSLPYGYVKYRLEFERGDEQRLFLDTQTKDPKQVFLNGRHVPALSSPEKSVSCSLDEWAKPGANLLEVSYEAFGSENGNAEMAELKGLTGIRLGDEQHASAVAQVSVQRVPQAVKAEGGDFDVSRLAGAWASVQSSGMPASEGLVPAFTWIRARFSLTGNPEWFAPWKLRIEAGRDAVIYLNGKFVGYYQAIGPQFEFFLPEPWLHLDGKQQNVVAVQLAYTDGPGVLDHLSVSPYTEHAARKTRVATRW